MSLQCKQEALRQCRGASCFFWYNVGMRRNVKTEDGMGNECAASRRLVLIAGIGTSPAVLTETVWALAHRETPQVPDEIVVITTKTGKARLRTDLIEGGVWRDLVDALVRERIPKAERLRLGETSVRVLPNVDGDEIDDLRTAEDNLCAADFMLRVIRQYTEDPSTAVFASLAGGRKTMSALLFSCMSLLGREEDKIFHVLTNPEALALKPTFYFPRAGAMHEFIESGKARKIAAARVAIDLFEVPFVRMRGWYQEKFKTIPPSYRTLVSRIQSVAPVAEVYPTIEIDAWSGWLCVGGKNAGLAPAEFAALVLLAQKCIGACLWKRLRDAHETRGSGHGCSLCTWLSGFQGGGRFNSKSDEDDLAKVLSSLRGKLSRMGLPNVEGLVPKRGRSVTFPVERIVWKNRKKLADICGCLFVRNEI